MELNAHKHEVQHYGKSNQVGTFPINDRALGSVVERGI